MDRLGFGVTQMLIPYFVPWLITGIANRLNCKARDCLLAAFPEANPDLVIKLDAAGNPVYVNRAVTEQLQEAGLSPDKPEVILPADYRNRLPAGKPGAAPLRLWHELGGRRIEYLVRHDGSCGGIFISGRIQSRH